MWWIIWISTICTECPPLVKGPYRTELECQRVRVFGSGGYWDMKGKCTRQPYPDVDPKHRLGSPSRRWAVNPVAMK
jgi:hypothetical protein